MFKKALALAILIPATVYAFTLTPCGVGSALQYSSTNGFTCGVPTNSMGNTYIADANYTAQSTDQVITYTTLTAPRTVLLTPQGSPSNLKLWQIKDGSCSASTTNYIKLASTTGTFDTLAFTAISEACGSKVFYDDGTNFFMGAAFLPSVNASTAIQKADGNGGMLNAVAGTDYMSPANVAASYVPQTTTVNGQPLSGNVTISIPSTTRTTSPLTLSLVGTGATGTQISATKDSSVCLTVSTSTTSTIGGPSTSAVMLKTFSSNSATEGNWVLGGQFESDQTITLAIALQSIQIVKGQVCTDVPAGYYVKIENSGTGTHTETFVTGQQTIYG